MKALLDTNALSALWNGDERVLDAFGEAERVFISIIVLGELFAGFRGGTRLKENRARLAGFLSQTHRAHTRIIYRDGRGLRSDQGCTEEGRDACTH